MQPPQSACRLEPSDAALQPGRPIDLAHPAYGRWLKMLKQLVSICDLEGHGICFSQTWLDYTGCSREALMGQGWTSVLHPDDRAKAWEEWGKGAQQQRPVTVELRIKAAADNTYHWWTCRGVLEKNQDGHPVQWIWMCSDIDAQINAARKARVDEERTRLVLQRAPLLGVRTDMEGRIEAIEGKGLEILGHSEPKLRGKNLLALTKQIPAMRDAVLKVLDGEPVTAEVHIRGEDWQVFFSPQQDLSGAQTGVLGLGVLVTERNRLARLAVSERAAREAAQVKGQFLANMSHEVRTPLAGVLGMAELLQDLPLTPEQRRYVQMIQASGQGLLHVINDILSFSQAQMTGAPRPLAPMAPRRILLNQVEMMRSLAMRKRLSLTTRVDDDVPETVLGDIGRVNQVLLNLLSNAIKFTHAGGIELSVRCEGNQQLRFAICDTGIGLDAQARARLFEPFVQATSSISGQYGGTGLGLSISRNLVTQMGGTIGIDSVVGQGSTFWFVLPAPLPAEAPAPVDVLATARPVFDPAATPAAGAASKSAHEGGATLKTSVLVVEDNRTNQILLSRQLEKFGLGCAIANHGAEALEMLRDHCFDLILMDCQMPTMDGYEATQHIRREETTTQKHVPIVAVTANVLEADQQRCREAGMDDYLAKPFNREQLAGVLARWVPQFAPTKEA